MNPLKLDHAPGMKTILNAVENAGRTPITPEGILAVLRGDGGNPSHVRAIFGDVSFQVLETAGAAAGIGVPTILASYRVARDRHAAANPQLDEVLAHPW